MGQRRPVNVHGEKPTSTLTPVAILAALILGLGMFRIWLFSDPVRLGEERFKKPVALTLMHLDARDPEMPEGWSRDREAEPAAPPASVRELAPHLPEGPSLEVPRPNEVVELGVSRYKDRSGTPAAVVVLRYPGAAAPAAPRGVAAVREGPLLMLILVEGRSTAPALERALSQKAARMAKLAVKLEKLKLLANTSIQLGMDLVLGSLAFVLALFFTKYLLIMRQIED